MGNNVVVTIYGKNSSKEDSVVAIETQKLKLDIKFKDGKEWHKEINLTDVKYINKFDFFTNFP